MISSLRKKFVFVAMSSTFAVLFVIVAAIQVINYEKVAQQADHLLKIMEDNQGEIPKDNPGQHSMGEKRERPAEGYSPEMPFITRYFSVTIDEDGEITDVQTQNIAAVQEDAAEEMGTTVWKKGKEKGFYQSYRYKIAAVEEGQMVIFVDCTKELQSFRSFLITSISVALAGLLLVFLLVLFFSKIVFKPVAESYEKQKRFITDASHELKTPLTIIDANTEVLEMVQGESEWTASIRNQVKRLTYLTQQMVTLTRMEESGQAGNMTVLSLSEIIREAAEPFLLLAEYRDRSLELMIEPDIQCRCDEKMMGQLVSLLLDNGVKYSLIHSTIQLRLEKKGKKAVFSISNLTDSISQGDLDILFERFYRTDTSRNSDTGGSGIGLSVAKAIVNVHKGKIQAYSSDGKSIVITVTLPCVLSKERPGKNQ